MTQSRRKFLRNIALVSGAGAAGAFAGKAAAQASLAPVAAPGAAQAAAASTSAAPSEVIGVASSAERALAIVNIEQLELDAKAVLPPGRFATMGPIGDGWTYRENRRAFNDFPIMPRRLQGTVESEIDLRTRLLDLELPFPMFTAPMGSHGVYHSGAEVVTARGTGNAGTLYVSSGASNRPIEEIARASTGPKWFQIYMNRDMDINRWLVLRARAAGCTAIVLTADALGPGQSDELIRLGRPYPPDLRPGNHDPALGGRGNFRDFKRDLGFADIRFLREASGLPVVVKGVLHPEDVQQCLAAGAAAIWVSNHGGRQLDGVPASISMLPGVAEVVAGRVPLILDSGVRRGIDVFKALALGATAVAVGRPVLWGLTNGGSAGVKSVYSHLAAELRSAFLLCGVTRVGQIRRDHITKKIA